MQVKTRDATLFGVVFFPTPAGVVSPRLGRGRHDAGDQQDLCGAAGPPREAGGAPGPDPDSDRGRRRRWKRPSAHTKDVR